MKHARAHILDYIRALRLPFVSVSIFGFMLGSLIERLHFNVINFFWGLIAAVATHLGANLINDYADSRSGADWSDQTNYNFFGGSKLIQEGVLSESWYLKMSVTCFTIAAVAVIALAVRLINLLPLGMYLLILFLGWTYSYRPFQFSYRRLGEPVIFLLFGPALVMGGYFVQTGIFPDLKSFALSLPLRILTTEVLFANEIPDFLDDTKAGKYTWVSFFGQARAYIFYCILIVAALSTIVFNITHGYLGKIAYLSFLAVIPACKAAFVLKNHYSDKRKLIVSSKLTILVHSMVSIILIVDMLLR